MVISSRTITRSADPKDLSRLANLVHFEVFVHRHLDYRPPLDWIGYTPFLVLEQASRIEAALACPPDPPAIAWIRLFATATQIPVTNAWDALWAESYNQLLTDPKILYAAAIPLYAWFEALLKRNHFQKSHSIVMLSWDGPGLPETPTNPVVSVRPMTLDDLVEVEVIDAASFSLVWQNSLTYLEIAFRQAAVATVAEYEGQLVGYQISTGTPIGGHLARLAVLPHLQGKGIGYALLHDLLNQFTRRGARTITVNTQKDNLASLALYRKSGFQMTGEEYPIYQLELPAR
jgi:[ribosomal protein S18]-alanine N-acetyltransferase